MTGSKLVGIVMVKNEDMFLGQVLQNISGFCDEIIITDNRSSDNTPAVIEDYCRSNPHARNCQIDKMSESHDLLQPYVGTNSWVFGVDGDEIYDPIGLSHFRNELKEGKYSETWMILGNVLHCKRLDANARQACGYLAPPCRSMTKLYNFNAIDAWPGSSGERLHGGTISFRKGFSNGKRLELCRRVTWEESLFRCLHMCFLQRSSLELNRCGEVVPRPNPADLMSRSRARVFKDTIKQVLRIPLRCNPEWKIDKFTRGALVSKDVLAFFRSTNPES